APVPAHRPRRACSDLSPGGRRARAGDEGRCLCARAGPRRARGAHPVLRRCRHDGRAGSGVPAGQSASADERVVRSTDSRRRPCHPHRRSDHLRRRGHGRRLRARRADEVRRPAHRGRHRGDPGRADPLAAVAGGGVGVHVRDGPVTGRPHHCVDHRGHGQRGELRRRARRAGRRRHRHRSRRVLRVCRLAGVRQRRHRGGERRGDSDRGACRRLLRLPAAQLLPGPDLHGRLGRPADRVHARRFGHQSHRSVPDVSYRPGGVRRHRKPADCPAPTDPAVRRLGGALRRSGACHHPADPGGAVAALPGQEASAPPVARDRSLAAAGGAGDVPVGESGGIRVGGDGALLGVVVGPRHLGHDGDRGPGDLRPARAQGDHQRRGDV
ncbi:MAG: Decaprenyl-phosphate N-acetylglucosaminephosphotransferase, partial [uncultured Nocardioidaceae bacterium]